MGGSNGNNMGFEQSQYTHRGRAIKSCLECRRRKMRCSRSQPCQNCSRFSRACVYLPYPDWPSSPLPGGLDGSSSRSSKKPSGQTHAPPRMDPQQFHDQRSPLNRSESELELDLHVKPGRSYNVAPNDVAETGIEIGRLKITEEFGPFSRSQLAKRVASALAQHNELNSPYSPQAALDSSRDDLSYYSQIDKGYEQTSHSRTLEPPSSLLLSASQCSQDWGNYFPSRNEIHILYHQYFAAVDPLAHVVHKPSFDQECYSLSASSQNLDSAPAPFKALLLSICLAAAVSLSPTQSQLELGIAKQNELVAKLKLAAENSLINANYLKTDNLQTLQAFTIYMIPQCRAEVSGSHIALVRALIELAKRAHLHLQPHESSASVVECQVRRLLWHQICFLDLRTAEIFGSQPIVRDDELGTPLPLNVNDEALGTPHDQSPSTRRWTDATFTLLRYECYLVHRLIFQQKKEVESNLMDFDSLRRVVDQQKAAIEEKYLDQLDETVPIQHYAKVVGRLLISSFNAMLLPGQLRDEEVTSSQREIRDTLIFSSLAICESAMILDTAPHFMPWSWYAGAYQGYCASIFLLLEVYENPKMPRADRIGVVLDHIYGPPSVSTRERNRDILRALAKYLQRHLDVRKMQPLQLPPGSSAADNLMDLPLSFGMIDPSQRINDWQAEMGYGQNYGQDMIPPTVEGWWNYQAQDTIPEHPSSREMWTADFGMNAGMD